MYYSLVFTTDTHDGVQTRNPIDAVGWNTQQLAYHVLIEVQAQAAEHLMFWRIEEVSPTGTYLRTVEEWHFVPITEMPILVTPPVVTPPARGSVFAKGSAYRRFLDLGQ